MKVTHQIESIELSFYKADDRHPWDYYEGLESWKGIHLTLAVPKKTPKHLIKEHIRKFKQEHDVVGYTIYRI